MPRRPKTLSIEELRQQLGDRLVAERDALLAQAAAIDGQIAALSGVVPAAPVVRRGRPGRKPGRPPGRKPGRPPKTPAGGNGRRRSRAGGRPLVDYIVDALKGLRGGMRVKDIMTACAKAGYRSASKDFYNIVAATVRDETRFRKLSRGIYTLA